MGQLTAEADDSVAKLKSETNRAEEIVNEIEKKSAEKEEEIDQLILRMQNQLTEKPISQYKTIFADQAKEHHKGAWNWLKMAGGGDCGVLCSFYRFNNMAGIRRFWTDWNLAKSLYKGVPTFTDLCVA